LRKRPKRFGLDRLSSASTCWSIDKIHSNPRTPRLCPSSGLPILVPVNDKVQSVQTGNGARLNRCSLKTSLQKPKPYLKCVHVQVRGCKVPPHARPGVVHPHVTRHGYPWVLTNEKRVRRDLSRLVRQKPFYCQRGGAERASRVVDS
jgi:hypothetical protein